MARNTRAPRAQTRAAQMIPQCRVCRGRAAIEEASEASNVFCDTRCQAAYWRGQLGCSVTLEAEECAAQFERYIFVAGMERDRGLFGLLFVVYNKELGRQTVIKAQRRSARAEQELRSACVLSALNSNFVEAYRGFYCDTVPAEWQRRARTQIPPSMTLFLEMERCEGTLQHLIAAVHLTAADWLCILFELVEALADASRTLGFVHGDIKLENILYRVDAQPRSYSIAGGAEGATDIPVHCASIYRAVWADFGHSALAEGEPEQRRIDERDASKLALGLVAHAAAMPTHARGALQSLLHSRDASYEAVLRAIVAVEPTVFSPPARFARLYLGCRIREGVEGCEEEFARYTLISGEALGKGAYGLVFRVYNHELRRQTVLKIQQWDEDVRAEMEAACRLTELNSNFVATYNCWRCEGVPADWRRRLNYQREKVVSHKRSAGFMEMERCEGTLAELLVAVNLSPRERLTVAYELVEALADAARTLGFVHGDITLCNVLYRIDAEPRHYQPARGAAPVLCSGVYRALWADFGFSKLRTESLSQIDMWSVRELLHDLKLVADRDTPQETRLYLLLWKTPLSSFSYEALLDALVESDPAQFE